MADKNLNIKVGLKGHKQTQQGLKGVDSAITKMGKAVGIASAAYFGATGLIRGFGKIIELAGRQEQAETKLNAVLKSTGGIAGVTANELKKMASGLQEVTSFGDEAIIEAQSLLLTFTKVGEDVFPKATETILNMSTAMGQDLQSATIQLGKALNDPITGISALSRVGVQLTDNQKAQIKSFTELGDIASAQKVILGELETQFGGLARATGDTMTGALNQTSNATGDLAEALGEKLSPMITSLAKNTTGFVTQLTELIEITGNSDSATLKFAEQQDKAEAVLDKYTKKLKINIDANKSLDEQLKELRQRAKEINETELFGGRLVSKSANAAYEAKNALLGYTEALEAYKKTALPLVERPLTFVASDEAELLDDAIINMDEMNEIMRESFKVNKENTEQTEKAGYSWEEFNKNLNVAVAGSVAAASSISSTSDALGSAGEAAKQASISFISAEIQKAVSSYISKFMLTTPLPPIVSAPLALAGGAAFGSLMSSAISRNFADGGIVDGDPSKGDVVPAMLTAGEVILNQSQQDNLVGNMGGVTINIEGNMIGNEEFVRDTLMPEVQKVSRENLA
jgi:hypothetical protein